MTPLHAIVLPTHRTRFEACEKIFITKFCVAQLKFIPFKYAFSTTLIDKILYTSELLQAKLTIFYVHIFYDQLSIVSKIPLYLSYILRSGYFIYYITSYIALNRLEPSTQVTNA